MSWEANKNHIIMLVQNGQANEATQAWYDRWVASGSPTTKDGMMDANEYAAWQEAQNAPAEEPVVEEPVVEEPVVEEPVVEEPVVEEPVVEEPVVEEPAGPSVWQQNKDHIISLVEAGTAGPSTQAWYDRWVASGSPATKEGMMSLPDYDTWQAENAPAEEEPVVEEPVVEEPVVEEPAGPTQWQINRDHIIRQVASGQAGPSTQAWYDRWQASGAPDTQDGMMSVGDYDTWQVENAPAEEEPVVEEPVVEEPSGPTQWQINRDHIIRQIASGEAGESTKAWYARWQASGSPDTQDGMMSVGEYDTWKSEQEPDLPAVEEEEPVGPTQWQQNKDHIIQQVAAGEAGATTQAWYDRWQASGSPDTQDGMMSVGDYDNWLSENAEPEPVVDEGDGKPDNVSQYIWDRVTGASPYGFNKMLIINDPSTRDALIGAGYGDYVKNLYEEAMDERAASYMGNGATAADAWDTAQYDWYVEQYGGYTNETVGGVGGDLGFGPEGTDPTDDPNYMSPEEIAAAEEQAAADAAAAQEAADAAAAQEAAEAAAAAAAAEAAAAAQAEADHQVYLGEVNEAMQAGIHGSAGVDNTWGSNPAGGQGMFGQAYGHSRPTANAATGIDPSVGQTMPANPNHAPNPIIPNGTGVGVNPSNVPQQPPSTPYADAYIRAKNAAEQPNAVTSIFGAELNK